MDKQRETISLGLQQGDTCRMITDLKQTIYVKAILTRNGYVKLEIDMPRRFWADRVPARLQGTGE